MNRHILQRKDPRIQMTQDPDTSEPKITTELANAKSRDADPVEVHETLTIEAYDPSAFDQVQRKDTVQFLKDNLQATGTVHKLAESNDDERIFQSADTRGTGVPTQGYTTQETSALENQEKTGYPT